MIDGDELLMTLNNVAAEKRSETARDLETLRTKKSYDEYIKTCKEQLSRERREDFALWFNDHLQSHDA